MTFQRILFPTDFSPCAEAALSQALFLAECFGSELHLLHAVTETDDFPPHYFSEPERILEEAERFGSNALAKIVGRQKEQTLRIVQKTERGDTPEDVILSYAATSGCDLIVMGTHGRKGLQHFLLGSISEAVSRRASVPVLTVRAGTPTFNGFREIVAAVDFGQDLEPLIGESKKLARAFKANLTLVHVLEDFLYPCYLNPGVSEFANLLPKIQEDRARMLSEKAREIAPTEQETKQEVLIGPCPGALLKYAEDNPCDLIIAATHTRSELSRLVLGSTVERIVRMAPCAVLTLHP